MASVTPHPTTGASSPTIRHYPQIPNPAEAQTYAFTYTVPRRVSTSVEEAIYFGNAANRYPDPEDQPCLTGRSWCCCKVIIGVGVVGVVSALAYGIYYYAKNY